MKRTLFLTTLTLLFLLSGSVVLAKNDAAKGQGGMNAEKQARQTGQATQDEAAKQAQTAQEKAKTQQRETEKQTRAAREKAEQAAAEAEKQEKAAKEKAQKQTEQAQAEAKKAREKAQGKKEAAQKDVEETEEAAEAAGKGKGKSEEAKGKGKGQAQKGEALAKQLEHEAQKHATRQARLAEMLKVAQDKGDEKAVARIEQLIEKEQVRYNKKHAKMTDRATEENSGDDEAE